jgi:charged multivesicular body protein 7
MSSPHPITQPPSLASRFIVAPLWWGMSKLNPFGSASGDEAKVESETKMWAKLNGTSLVHLDLVEEASVAFMKLLSADPPVTHSAQLLTVQTFNARYGESLLSSRLKGTSSRKARISSGDCRILLRYLSRDKGVLVSDEKGEVRFNIHACNPSADQTTSVILARSTKYCLKVVQCRSK